MPRPNPSKAQLRTVTWLLLATYTPLTAAVPVWTTAWSLQSSTTLLAPMLNAAVVKFCENFWLMQ